MMSIMMMKIWSNEWWSKSYWLYLENIFWIPLHLPTSTIIALLPAMTIPLDTITIVYLVSLLPLSCLSTSILYLAASTIPLKYKSDHVTSLLKILQWFSPSANKAQTPEASKAWCDLACHHSSPHSLWHSLSVLLHLALLALAGVCITGTCTCPSLCMAWSLPHFILMNCVFNSYLLEGNNHM